MSHIINNESHNLSILFNVICKKNCILLFFFIYKYIYTYTMSHIFFHLLPCDIIHHIYGIRLSDALTRTYYRNVARQLALAKFVLYLHAHHNAGFNLYPYFDPTDPAVVYVVERCAKFLRSSPDNSWWINMLIHPIEQGIIFQTNDANNHNENYARCEYACDRLIEILGCTRNPIRNTSLS